MSSVKDCNKQYLHQLSEKSVRGRILHALHSRAMLIFVCTLVILECFCVMAELMVDLHAIRVRFDHEEEELNKFSQTLKSRNGDCSTETRTLGDLIDLVIDVHSKNNTLCQSTGPSIKHTFSKRREKRSMADQKRLQDESNKLLTSSHGKKSVADQIKLQHDLNKLHSSSRDSRETDHESVIKRRSVKEPAVFVFSLHADEDSYYVVSTFEELNAVAFKNVNTTDHGSRYTVYTEEYEKIQSVSHIIKYIGFSILSVMVLETLLKMMCLGIVFFKKKIEVFDAVIVMVSFVLDVIFLDSNWYESGKDATSVLVLLLPWRIVRIINSFVMTINHKHHIELMTVKRSKKKIVLKLKKLRHLMLEMRRDIDLLITLSKSKGASDPEIFNCIYGKGRGTKSLAAITSFASLMFISTLGKDPSNTGNTDDMYGELIKDILGDDDDDEDDDTDIDKITTDISEEKDLYDCIETDNNDVNVLKPETNKRCTKRTSFKNSTTSGATITRRVTLPRRQKSCSSDDENPVFYINDACDIEEEVPERNSAVYKYRRNVQSLPQICSSVRGKNFVTFEVTTQVTYL